MKYADIKEATRTCRDVTLATDANFTERPIGGGYMVRATRYTFINGRKADVILYYLIDPKGFSHGGYTSIQRFASYCQGALED